MVSISRMVTGIMRVKSAVSPRAMAMGTNTASVVPVAAPSGRASSRTETSAARIRSTPRSRCHWMFSTMTMALSTSMPSAMTSAPSEIRCSSMP